MKTKEKMYPCITKVVVVNDVSHVQRIGCQHQKTTLHGGQPSSWSVEQGKKLKKSGSAPLSKLLVWRKEKKTT